MKIYLLAYVGIYMVLTVIPVDTMLTYIWEPAKLYLFWTVVHFASTNLYQYFCAKLSLWGFVTSSIYTQFPYCKALSWIQTTSIKTIDSYWAVATSYLVGRATGFFGGVK